MTLLERTISKLTYIEKHWATRYALQGNARIDLIDLAPASDYGWHLTAFLFVHSLPGDYSLVAFQEARDKLVELDCSVSRMPQLNVKSYRMEIMLNEPRLARSNIRCYLRANTLHQFLEMLPPAVRRPNYGAFQFLQLLWGA